MCKEIVEGAGATCVRSGLKTFPNPEEILSRIPRGDATYASLGYRSQSLRQLAQTALEEDAWLLDPSVRGPCTLLRERVAMWPGFGPYATDHLMALLGDYSVLPVDREVGKQIGIHTPGKAFKPKSPNHFSSWGSFRFTAYKLTRVE